MQPNQKPQRSSEADVSVWDRLAFFVATGAGAGLLPGAPGTYGSVEGVAAYLGFCVLARKFNLAPGEILSFLVIINLIIYAIGTLSSGAVCGLLDSKDPQQVVVDEISGQFIALTPMLAAPSVIGTLTGFVLFRLFDITKPLLIRRAERLPRGFGVMTDDALAGVYAAALIWLGRFLRLI